MLNKYYCYLLLLLLLLCSHVPIDYYYLTSENYETSLYRYYLTIAHHQNVMRSLIYEYVASYPTPISKNNNIIGTRTMLLEHKQYYLNRNKNHLLYWHDSIYSTIINNMQEWCQNTKIITIWEGRKCGIGISIMVPYYDIILLLWCKHVMEDADTSRKFLPRSSIRPLLSTGRDTPLFVDNAQLPTQSASQTQTSIGPQKRSCSAHLTQRSG